MLRLPALCVLLCALVGCASAQKKADEAHRGFKREIKPAADFVDDKSKKAVDEGKKGVRKVTGEDGDE